MKRQLTPLANPLNVLRKFYDASRSAFLGSSIICVLVILTATVPLYSPYKPDAMDFMAPRADGYPDTPIGSMCHHTFNANLAGLPALSVPCGIAEAGLPFGFQLTGRTFDEAMVYRIANAYEREHDWHLRKAPLLEGV